MNPIQGRQHYVLLAVAWSLVYLYLLVRSSFCPNELQSYSQEIVINNEDKNMLSHTSRETISIEYDEDVIDCGVVAKKLEMNLKRSEMNSLRRQVALTNPSCFEKYRSVFAQQFLEKIVRTSQYILHPAKTAGTSLCALARKNSLDSYHRANCWHGVFLPVWCCFDPSERKPLNCSRMKQNHKAFVMNENYIDYPMCEDDRSYSMLLRDPVKRSVSHVRHLVYLWHEFKDEKTLEHMGWRLHAGMTNFMTWTLVAGKYDYPYTYPKQDEDYANVTVVGPNLYIPRPHDLQLAKEILRSLDFLMDLTDNTWKHCNQLVMYDFMGMKKTVVKNTNGGQKYIGNATQAIVPITTYRAANDMDIALYNYAKRIRDVDCEFFYSILNKTRPTKTTI